MLAGTDKSLRYGEGERVFFLFLLDPGADNSHKKEMAPIGIYTYVNPISI